MNKEETLFCWYVYYLAHVNERLLLQFIDVY